MTSRFTLVCCFENYFLYLYKFDSVHERNSYTGKHASVDQKCNSYLIDYGKEKNIAVIKVSNHLVERITRSILERYQNETKYLIDLGPIFFCQPLIFFKGAELSVTYHLLYNLYLLF